MIFCPLSGLVKIEQIPFFKWFQRSNFPGKKICYRKLLDQSVRAYICSVLLTVTKHKKAGVFASNHNILLLNDRESNKFTQNWTSKKLMPICMFLSHWLVPFGPSPLLNWSLQQNIINQAISTFNFSPWNFWFYIRIIRKGFNFYVQRKIWNVERNIILHIWWIFSILYKRNKTSSNRLQ